MRSEGLEIGLNAGATARIGTGNSQNAERASVGRRHESTCGTGVSDHSANGNGAGVVRQPMQIMATWMYLTAFHPKADRHRCTIVQKFDLHVLWGRAFEIVPVFEGDLHLHGSQVVLQSDV